MNKKHSTFAIFVIFFLCPTIFAAQGYDYEKYESILTAYNQGTKYFKQMAMVDNTYSPTIQEHKDILEGRKQAIQSSYMPLLLNFIATSLAASATGMGYYAVTGAVGANALFNQLPEWTFRGYTYKPGHGFIDYLKHSVGLNKGFISDQKNQFTQAVLASPDQQKIIEGGVAAVPLAAGSLVAGALSLYLFKKAASYKEEIAQIDEQIARDKAMLNILDYRS